MALDDSSAAATTSPTASDGAFSSHILASSISSLSSSTSSARQTASYVSKTYRQASTLFLTRRLPEALSTLLPLITSPDADVAEPVPVARSSRGTRVKVWSLYLTILNAVLELDPSEGKDAFGTQEWRSICAKVREGDVWEEVVRNGYHGIEGNVDSDVVINLATLLLAHARNQTLNQKRLESYLAAANNPNLDISDRILASPSSPRPPRYRSPAKGAASGANTPRDLNARVKILELYTLHVLLRNNEWDYAREFISMSSVLDDERREAFLQALQSLQEEQQEVARQEREEKQLQEDQLRRDIEEARKLRAENEERERRIAEERQRAAQQLGVDEVDYGIERTPPSGSSIRRPLNRPGGPGAQSSKKKARVAAPAPTLGNRAALMLSNIRAIMERVRVSLQSNPMLLLRLLAFVMGLLLVLGRRGMRERISRALGGGWNKVKATAGMGVKVSYI